MHNYTFACTKGARCHAQFGYIESIWLDLVAFPNWANEDDGFWTKMAIVDMWFTFWLIHSIFSQWSSMCTIFQLLTHPLVVCYSCLLWNHFRVFFNWLWHKEFYPLWHAQEYVSGSLCLRMILWSSWNPMRWTSKCAPGFFRYLGRLQAWRWTW